jgi:hypothetical protein
MKERHNSFAQMLQASPKPIAVMAVGAPRPAPRLALPRLRPDLLQPWQQELQGQCPRLAASTWQPPLVTWPGPFGEEGRRADRRWTMATARCSTRKNACCRRLRGRFDAKSGRDSTSSSDLSISWTCSSPTASVGSGGVHGGQYGRCHISVRSKIRFGHRICTVWSLFGGTIHKCAVSSSALRPPSLSVEDSMAESRLNREYEGRGEGAGRKRSG